MKKHLLLILIFALSINIISTGQKQSLKAAKAVLCADVDSILQSQVDLDKIPGAVILIKQGNKTIYKHAYGYAQKYDYNHNLTLSPEKMTMRHLFDIASLTKVIGTTASIMMMADKGLINIDDSVYKFIKDFETPEKKGITIRHLLTHTAGLHEWYPLYYRASGKKETYTLIGELPLKYPVGERRSYSDLGFVLLGEIVETVSGISLDEFMKQNIFLPLRMKNTTFNPLANGRIKKIAATSLINKGEAGSGQFISEKTIDTFLTKDKFNNGLGWMMDPANSFMRNAPEGSFGHTGFTGTSISVIPEKELTVILLINRQNTGLLESQEYYNVNPVRLQIFNSVLKYLR